MACPTQGRHQPPLTCHDFESVKDEIRERLMVTRRGRGFVSICKLSKERYPVAIYDQRIDDVIHAINTQTEPHQT
ncbi:MAG: hypothetical protein R3C68_11730 [Myxococcota bacterium]